MVFFLAILKEKYYNVFSRNWGREKVGSSKDVCVQFGSVGGADKMTTMSNWPHVVLSGQIAGLIEISRLK